MKSIEIWLDEYGESHQNPVNKAIHWCAVPVIYACVFGLLWAVPTPQAFGSEWVNWATIIMIPVMIFYFMLSKVIAMAMVAFTLALAVLVNWYEGLALLSVAWLSIILFVVMWVFQFIGHAIEGKKPSFFKDVQFLLIGPIWLMADLLRRMGVKY